MEEDPNEKEAEQAKSLKAIMKKRMEEEMARKFNIQEKEKV